MDFFAEAFRFPCGLPLFFGVGETTTPFRECGARGSGVRVASAGRGAFDAITETSSMVLSQTPRRRPVVTLLALAGGLSAQALAADATYRVVARSGQFAPGGGVYSGFGTPGLSETGRGAFKGEGLGVPNNH